MSKKDESVGGCEKDEKIIDETNIVLNKTLFIKSSVFFSGPFSLFLLFISFLFLLYLEHFFFFGINFC